MGDWKLLTEIHPIIIHLLLCESASRERYTLPIYPDGEMKIENLQRTRERRGEGVFRERAESSSSKSIKSHDRVFETFPWNSPTTSTITTIIIIRNVELLLNSGGIQWLKLVGGEKGTANKDRWSGKPSSNLATATTAWNTPDTTDCHACHLIHVSLSLSLFGPLSLSPYYPSFLSQTDNYA